MRLKLNLLLAFLLFASMNTFAQKRTTVSLSLQNTTLKGFIQSVEKQTDYAFVYDNSVNMNQRISVSSNKEPVASVLGRVMPKANLAYEIVKKQIILKPAGKNKKTCSGRVLDSKGEPIIGASVMVKGTSAGTITDIDGKYTLNDVPADASLVISYVGYQSQNISARNGSSRIVLKESAENLNEVVVVGYGTQKKVNLTGSVSSITDKALDSRPITQSSQALAGLASGVTVSMAEGNPGGDGATIRVRGQGTFSGAGSDPLVLIDGLSASLDDVDPNNIKSISVLKDAASAAIYGTRAANGVILIETKRGQAGKMQVSYNGYVGWQKATELPDYVDSWEYATMRNEADKNEGKAATYTDEAIAKFKDGSDPDNYPNVNHLKDLVKSGSGFQTAHNVSFTGGGERYSYMLSLGYLRQEGITARTSYDKYTFQFNVDNQITDHLHLKADLSGHAAVQKSPRGDGDFNFIIGMTTRESAVFAGRKSDGTYGHQDNFCPEGWMDSESFTNNKNNEFMGGVELEWNPFKNFYISGKGGYKYINYYNKDFTSELVCDEYYSIKPNKLTVDNGWNSLITFQGLARYNFNINDHQFNILGGISQEEYKGDWGSAYRQTFPNNELYELDAASTTGMTNSGSGTEWALRSFFGRINYSYLGRYLFEANARYDGTSRFPSDGRWGFFPSVSAGWRISEESFIKDNFTWIDNLKLRLSWGRLGNQNIGNYPYQNVLTLGRNYPFGNVMSSGAAVTTLANSNISWETTEVADLGLDFTILKGKLDAVIDFYNKKTSDILYKIAASSILGTTPSEVNAASVRNRGFEIALTYRDRIGKVNFAISPNFSYTKNEVISLANGLQKDINSNLFVGESLGAIYGYVADGLFVDQNDIDTYATQPYVASPGYVKYKDISGPDGVPDGKVDATYDRKVIGSTLPKYTYGLTLSADYKNFDFSVLLSGMGGNKKQMNDYQSYAFYNSGNIQKWQVDNRWTSDNPDPNAKYIKLTSLNKGAGTLQTSTYWLRSASFLRLKNIQIGYTIPKELTAKMGLSQVRVYFSGQNLFCVKNFYQGWDPEMVYSTGTQPSFYPITSVYTFGLNIKF
jgi:TonB-linked SusC/RagA family outer membrane protein